MIQLTDDELLRYSRQILLPEWDLPAQQALKQARVLIIGMGGLGCPVAHTLARAGLGMLRLVDDDVIEASNLQRQTLFVAEDIGQAKAEVAAKRLMHINPWLSVDVQILSVNADNIDGLFADVDLVLDCSDNFTTRDLINRAAVQHGIPLLSAAAIGLSGQLALFESATGCYRCVFSDLVSGLANNDATCATSGVLASTTAVVANLQAHVALMFLGLHTNLLANKLLLWQGTAIVPRVIRYQKDPHCPVCGVSVG